MSGLDAATAAWPLPSRAAHPWAAAMSRPAIWLVDLGNSRLKCARADRLAADGARAFAHAGVPGDAALVEAFATVGVGDTVWVASVASPAATSTVVTALGARGARVQRALTQAQCAGVRIAYAQPAHLGVDRFLALLAAHARAAHPGLIASVGTALTIDLLGADGTHHGGLIAPAPTLMRESLVQRAPHLPAAGGVVVDFAADTADALASGVMLAARALIARSMQAARRRLGVAPCLLIAGGGADALLDGWRVRAQRAPDLVLEGLRIYARDG